MDSPAFEQGVLRAAEPPGARPFMPMQNGEEVVMNELLLPVHTRSNGAMMGGQIMAWMDLCAGIASKRHCRFHVVTASMDDLQFQHHALLGDVVSIKARVNRAFVKSMEVSVTVTAYNPLSDAPHKTVCSAFFTFVRGDGAKVFDVQPATEEHRKEWEAAAERRKIRLARRRITQRRRSNVAAAPGGSASGGGGRSGGDGGELQSEDLTPCTPLKSASRSVPFSTDTDIATGRTRRGLLEELEQMGSPPTEPIAIPRLQFKEGSRHPIYRFGRDSAVQMTHLVLPSDANTVGITFGGQIMKWIENATSISACRHSRQMCANVSFDSLHFLQPCKVGEAVSILSQVNRAFDGEEMEIGVTVEAEDLMTGEKRHCCSGYTTYVGLGREGEDIAVPDVIPQTDAEIRRYHNAKIRRSMRQELELHRPAAKPASRSSPSWTTNIQPNGIPSLRWSLTASRDGMTPSRGDGDDAT